MARRAVTALTTRALRAAARDQYICQACLAQTERRAIHSSSRQAAQEPVWKQLRNTLFGSKKAKTQQSSEEQVDQDKEVSGKTALVEASEKAKPARRQRKAVDFRNPNMQQAPRPPAEHEYAQISAGLRVIGGKRWAAGQADTKEQKYSSSYKPKGAKARLTDAEWALLLRHTFIEIRTLQTAGRSAKDITNRANNAGLGWEPTSEAKIVLVDGLAPASIEYALAEHQQLILDGILTDQQMTESSEESENELPLRPIVMSRKSTSTVNVQQDETWMAAPFTGDEMKLALIRRVTQLTGHRPSDFAMSDAKTWRDVYESVKEREAPKKLVDSKQVEQLREGSNVTVYARRRSMHQKEDEIGRWKLIERELEERGLPLYTGSKKRKQKTAEAGIL